MTFAKYWEETMKTDARNADKVEVRFEVFVCIFHQILRPSPSWHYQGKRLNKEMLITSSKIDLLTYFFSVRSEVLRTLEYS